MAGMSGTFDDVKRVIVIVVILVVVAFGLGYCKGFEAGKSELSVPDWKKKSSSVPEWKK